MKNKKGMLGNIIGAFIVLLVGITLAGTISQEFDNIINCNQTNQTNYTIQYEEPIGETNSFGGGGGHFGGYDGTIKKSWSSNLAPYKTNESVLFPNCLSTIQGANATVLGLVPIFFALAIMAVAVGMIYPALRNTGLV